jgi:hypothetical protein
MKSWVAATGLCLLAGGAQAGVLHCSFTEPFFNITYDSATGKVILVSADVFDENGKPIPEVIAEKAKLEYSDPAGDRTKLALKNGNETILRLELTGQGSDGMSDNMFPFQAWYGQRDGGCDTEKYPSWDTYYLLEDLGVAM